ncbi:hypothetical protein [Cyclobacterium amurskyense]|uniref:hypothetical protein n=1 Tax=Cyclobacterium amurskyense TaxID=320787 RepID=UPI0030D73198|tara:strand:+ start:6583 stop:7395 length:813 start_codon:yes stop_codon:yes gene_type:complete
MEELINNLDNWTIFKIFGGTTVVVSAVVIYLSKLLNEKIILSWKSKNDNRIEKIKGAINKNNSITSTLTQQVGQNFQKLQDKKITAIEKYWVNILSIKSAISPVVSLFYSIFSDEELTVEKINSGKSDFGKLLGEFSQYEFTENLTKGSDEIAKFRPFLSENLWVLMHAYQGFIGRCVFLLVDGYQKNDIHHWKTDNGIKQIAMTVLNEKEFEYIISLKSHSFESMLQLLENKILAEVSKLISSKDFTINSLEELKTINTILDQHKNPNI